MGSYTFYSSTVLKHIIHIQPIKMASSPKKKKKKKKKKKETNRFKSTVGWVKQMVYNKKENHNSLINRFELLYESGNRQSIIDPRPLVAGVPVNILCIDGGGLRGE
jgi:hypothetical protein